MPRLQKTSRLFICCSLLVASCGSSVQKQDVEVGSMDSTPKLTGAMRNAIHRGEIAGIIDIDTIAAKQHLYGLGPVEYLTGEILILDGKGYKSLVVDDSTMSVIGTFSMKAPFFAHANIDRWTEMEIPDSIATIAQLESMLEMTTSNFARPFFFRLTATVDQARIHIVNLPKGTKVSSPDEAHLGKRSFHISNTTVEMLGFFSTEHKGIFTHHDSFVHIHLITTDRTHMGHLEELKMKRGTARLYLPAL